MYKNKMIEVFFFVFVFVFFFCQDYFASIGEKVYLKIKCLRPNDLGSGWLIRFVKVRSHFMITKGSNFHNCVDESATDILGPNG